MSRLSLHKVLELLDTAVAESPLTKLETPLKTTAKQIQQVSGGRAQSKKRENRLKSQKNSNVRSGLEKLKLSSLKFKPWAGLVEVENGCRIKVEESVSLRNFFSSKQVQSLNRTVSIRRHQAIAKLMAKERKWVAEVNGGSKVPFLAYGAAGTGVGSRIRGSLKAGGKKYRKEHAVHTPVLLTNENVSELTRPFVTFPMLISFLYFLFLLILFSLLQKLVLVAFKGRLLQ